MIDKIKSLFARMNHWREQVRLRRIEQEIENLRLDIESTYLHLNALIREKSQLEIDRHRRETAQEMYLEASNADN